MYGEQFLNDVWVSITLFKPTTTTFVLFSSSSVAPLTFIHIIMNPVKDNVITFLHFCFDFPINFGVYIPSFRFVQERKGKKRFFRLCIVGILTFNVVISVT